MKTFLPSGPTCVLMRIAFGALMFEFEIWGMGNRVDQFHIQKLIYWMLDGNN